MSPSYSKGRAARYRYYVSTAVQQARRSSPDALLRVSAQPLETLVRERAGSWARVEEPTWSEVRRLVRRVDVHRDAVVLWADPVALPQAPADPDLALGRLKGRLHASETYGQDPLQPHLARITIAIRVLRRGQRTSIITPDGEPLVRRGRCDQTLVKGIRSAHALARAVHAQPLSSVDELLRIERPASWYQRKLINLAYLAPDIQAAIFEGHHPPELTMERLMEVDLPMAWPDQRIALGFVRRL